MILPQALSRAGRGRGTAATADGEEEDEEDGAVAGGFEDEVCPLYRMVDGISPHLTCFICFHCRTTTTTTLMSTYPGSRRPSR